MNKPIIAPVPNITGAITHFLFYRPNRTADYQTLRAYLFRYSDTEIEIALTDLYNRDKVYKLGDHYSLNPSNLKDPNYGEA